MGENMINEEDVVKNILIPVWKSNKTKLHPALDFIDNAAFVSQFMTYTDVNNNEEEYLTIIKSDKSYIIVKDDKSLLEQGIKATHMPNKMESRWSIDSIHHYTNGSCPVVTMKEVYDDIMTSMKEYIDLPDKTMYDVLTCWAIGTYFHQMFNCFPYIFLNAMKRSGKTKILTLMNCLCFNAKFTMSVTPSTLFRLVQDNRCTLLIDETENLGGKEFNEFRSMLLSGYKKGIRVPRAQEMSKKKRFEVGEYDLYSPKMLANISGIEDVLEDRCITMILMRTMNRLIGNREIDINDERWQKIRDKLYINLMTNWKELQSRYIVLTDTFLDSSVVSDVSDVSVDSISKEVNSLNKKNLYIDIDIKTSLTSLNLPINKNDEKSFVDCEKETSLTSLFSDVMEKKYADDHLITSLDILKNRIKNIKNRDLELWLPIFSIAMTIDEAVFNSVVDYAIKSITNKDTENITENTDLMLIDVLFELVNQDDYYSIRDINTKLRQFMDLDEHEGKWLNSKWLGRAMKRLGFLDKRRIGNKGAEYRITTDRVKDLVMRSNLSLERFTKQQSLKDTAPSV